MSIVQASTSYKQTRPPQGAGSIPLVVPEISGNEWKYLKECLDTGWISSAGPFVERFERTVGNYLGVESAVATVNGTAALHIALLVAGIEPETEVLVPALTFVAPANAIRYVGAHPVFIDVDPATWQIDTEKVSDFLRKECHPKEGGGLIHRATGRRVSGILPVHILGHPCDMDPLCELGRTYNLRIIEDAAEALGARYRGKRVGALGDVAGLSFNGNKVVTAGGGGMVLSRNPEWGRKARYLTTQAKDHPVEYIHNQIGYNYRMTNLEAAVGCAQMERLEIHLERKRRIAFRYREKLSLLPGVEWMPCADWAEPTYWLSTIRLKGYGPTAAERLVAFLRERGIEARRLWRPLPMLPIYRDAVGYHVEVAPLLYAEAVMLPSSVGLSQGDQERVIQTVQAWHHTLEAVER